MKIIFANVSTLSYMLLSLMPCSTAGQGVDNCSGVKKNFPVQSLGTCLTDWEDSNRGDVKSYPDDFEGLSSKVEVWKCPSENKRVIISNGVPDHDVTIYNSNALCEINWVVEMPLNPTQANSRTEVPIRGMIAMAINGVPAYGPQESDSLNAVEITESDKTGAGFWYGHSGADNVWHVHNPQMGEETVTSDELLGYAMDGFPIYGPLDDDSVGDLDACNGMVVDGNYQYHVRTFEQVDETLEYCNGDSAETNWNYILGCYSGSVDGTEIYDSTTYTLNDDCVPDDTSSTDGPVVVSPTDGPVVVDPTESPSVSPTDGPVVVDPTKSPSVSPTDGPVVVDPTESPTVSPTKNQESSCLDSPLKVQKYSTCQGVVDADKCSKKKFWSHCRVSCGKCNKCLDSLQKLKLSQKVTIIFEKNGETVTKKKKKFKCKQVKKATNKDDICQNYSDVATSCPKTCGGC
uniref:YHYH domain-containing protein n=3 Tax=Pseudo-nitzschia australis TaxID=44445 RepID=A0A7S4ENB0_9STRA